MKSDYAVYDWNKIRASIEYLKTCLNDEELRTFRRIFMTGDKGMVKEREAFYRHLDKKQ